MNGIKEDIMRSVEEQKGFSPSELFSPDKIGPILQSKNEIVSDQIKKYPFMFVMFPNHISLLVNRSKKPKTNNQTQ
jgi:hypothetical protein